MILEVRLQNRSILIIIHLVYDQRTQNVNCVAPIPEQIETTTMHFSEVSGDIYCFLKTSYKCIAVVFICSGMGATNFKGQALTGPILIYKELQISMKIHNGTLKS